MAETKVKKTKTAKVETPKKEKIIAKVAKPKKEVVVEAETSIVEEAPKPTKASDSALSTKSKQELIQLFGTKDGDTGSPEVQVALATHKVFNLTAHLDQNPKDNHSRRGLLKVISKRRRILNYLQERDDKRYKVLIKKLELKR
jgi:small subunit ribosomal protein S15